MIPINIKNEINNLGHKYKVDKIVLFGSRARNDEHPKSDIDIAVFGLAENKHASFCSDIDEIETLLQFDIIFITDNTSPDLLTNIKKDGILIMDKTGIKFANYLNALRRLDESIADYDKFALDSIRDGALQRFEFCTELAWKTMREYLLDQGYTDINSPKSVMKTAYADGIINDEAVWIDILNSRNITSHIYDEETAKEVYENIANVYQPVFYNLFEKLKANI